MGTLIVLRNEKTRNIKDGMIGMRIRGDQGLSEVGSPEERYGKRERKEKRGKRRDEREERKQNGKLTLPNGIHPEVHPAHPVVRSATGP